MMAKPMGGEWRETSWSGIFALALVAAAAGCDFFKLEDDLERMQDVAHVFAGTVSAVGIEADAIVVLALRDRQGESIAGFRVMSGPGPFELRSDPTPTFFFGFEDLNRDLRFQANEPYGWAAAGAPLDPSTEPTGSIDIAIEAVADNRLEVPRQLIGEPLENHISDNVRFNLGTVSSLENAWFSEAQARKGLWEPFAFMEDGGAGIHFLEPYDPDRIPVLFVHGISGTPQNFSALIDRLDQSRFQAWVYSYASGLRLSWLAYGMYQSLEILHRQYDFDDLHVIAHSMGGLVSRAGVNLCFQNNACDYLRSYTSLSTPWGGVASAANGVEWAPTVVPVWRDLDPSSEFVTTLFDTPLPDGVPYHLLFGFRQSSIFGSQSGDGVISLASQLRDAAQDQALLMRGYDEGHVSILSSERVLGDLEEILIN